MDLDEIVSYLDGTEADSSCVLIDKKENWDALVVVAILNGPMQSVTYKRWDSHMKHCHRAVWPIRSLP